MVTFAELRSARPQAYRRAAQAWLALVAAMDRQAGEVAAGGFDLAGGWTGTAGGAAAQHLAALSQALTDRAARAGAVPGILAEHASGIAAAQATAERVLAAAAGTPIRVDGAGRVSLSPLVALQPVMLSVWLRLAIQLQELIDRTVAAANTVDQVTTGHLRAAMPPQTVGAPGQPSALDQIPRPGAQPHNVAQWWRALTAAEHGWLLSSVPERIGNLDGIPAADRHRANRRVLAAQTARLQRRRAELSGDSPERSDVDDKLNGIEAIQRRLHDTGPGKPRAYLLGFDVGGRGHAIVAMGDPDTADNVVTYVPGTGTRLGSIEGDLGRADVMVDSARAADASETTVAIAWIGYDAPQEIISTRLGHLGDDATSDQYAMAARDRLDRFQDGLRVTHQGARSHNSVLGHSFGSTVVGYSARDRGLDVDDLIFVGSPGVGVEHARDLGIPPEHVWSTTARNDPIQYGFDPAYLLHPRLWQEVEVDLIHGGNPSSPEFGGQVFASDPGDPLVKWEWEDGPFGLPMLTPHFSVSAHSQYWDPGSASLINMGHLIVGNRPVRN